VLLFAFLDQVGCLDAAKWYLQNRKLFYLQANDQVRVCEM
jgi:hypothetical protein